MFLMLYFEMFESPLRKCPYYLVVSNFLLNRTSSSSSKRKLVVGSIFIMACFFIYQVLGNGIPHKVMESVVIVI